MFLGPRDARGDGLEELEQAVERQLNGRRQQQQKQGALAKVVGDRATDLVFDVGGEIGLDQRVEAVRQREQLGIKITKPVQPIGVQVGIKRPHDQDGDKQQDDLTEEQPDERWRSLRCWTVHARVLLSTPLPTIIPDNAPAHNNQGWRTGRRQISPTICCSLSRSAISSAMKSPAIHHASSARNSSPTRGPGARPAAMTSPPPSGKRGGCQRSARV